MRSYGTRRSRNRKPSGTAVAPRKRCAGSNVPAAQPEVREEPRARLRTRGRECAYRGRGARHQRTVCLIQTILRVARRPTRAAHLEGKRPMGSVVARRRQTADKTVCCRPPLVPKPNAGVPVKLSERAGQPQPSSLCELAAAAVSVPAAEATPVSRGRATHPLRLRKAQLRSPKRQRRARSEDGAASTGERRPRPRSAVPRVVYCRPPRGSPRTCSLHDGSAMRGRRRLPSRACPGDLAIVPYLHLQRQRQRRVAVNIKSEPPRAVEREPQQGHIARSRRAAVVRSDAVHTNIASLSPAAAQGRQRRPAAPAVLLRHQRHHQDSYSLTVLPDALDSESFIHYCHVTNVRIVN